MKKKCELGLKNEAPSLPPFRIYRFDNKKYLDLYLIT